MIRNIFIAKMEDPTAYDQNASYMIAYCFLIDIFLLSHNKSYPKFSFLDKKWYRTLKILMLPYFLIMILKMLRAALLMELRCWSWAAEPATCG